MILIIFFVYYMIIIIAAWYGSLAVRAVVSILAILIPDPLPFVDEIIIVISWLKRYLTYRRWRSKVSNW